jgi:Ca2+-binding RTX toxin-like protein
MLRSVLLALAALAVAAPAAAAHGGELPDAEIFATDNTALITDPEDPRLDDRLQGFARTVERIVDDGGGKPRGSELLDGVFFSSDLGGTTFERSRAFDVDRVGDAELRRIADRVRRRFLQQSVLTFDHLHPHDRDVDAVQLEVPGVTAQALRDGLLADAAQARLFGGSVTLDGRLILVAALEDADLARNFAERIGGDVGRAKTRYGEREFVDGASPVRIEDGAVVVEGDADADRLHLRADGGRLEIELGDEEFEARLDSVTGIRADLGGGADRVHVGDLTGLEVRLDLGAGDGRVDRVEVDTSNEDEQVLALGFGASVAVLGPSFVQVDGPEPTDRLIVNGRDGDDIVSASTAAMAMTLDGGDGTDTLLGGPGDDVLMGGDDFDDVQGRRGDDRAFMGGSPDRFSWAPGDGSDSVDGGRGHDSMFFLGSADAERFAATAHGRRVRFTRDVGSIVMDLEDLEEIDTLAGRGADTVAIGDLSRTPVDLVDISLSPGFGAPGGDGEADRVEVTSTDRNDDLTVTGRVVVAGTATLTGLPTRVNVSHAEGTLDKLAINTRAGDDTVDSSGLQPGTIGLEVD